MFQYLVPNDHFLKTPQQNRSYTLHTAERVVKISFNLSREAMEFQQLQEDLGALFLQDPPVRIQQQISLIDTNMQCLGMQLKIPK